MLHRLRRLTHPIRAAFGLVLVCSLAAPALGTSTILSPTGDFAAGYEAHDYFGDQGSIDAFDVWSDRVVTWTTSGVQIFNRTSGAVEESLGGAPQAWFDGLPPELGVFPSFTTFDPGGESVWVGFTTEGNIDDRVYHVQQVGGQWQWEHKATLLGNLELEFRGPDAYASANPAAAAWGAEAAVYRLDTSMPGGVPATEHDLIAQIGGYASGLAFDAAGGLYYGTFVLSGVWPDSVSSGTLYQFAGDDVDQAIGDGHLVPSQAIMLADLDAGIADVTVDQGGHVMFTANESNGPSYVAMWDGENTGSGNNYDLIADGTGASGNYLVGLKPAGDFTAGGVLYVNDRAWGDPYVGVAGIRVVPEPSTLVMILCGAVGLLFWWWRRRNG